jgi:hypothetical protein
MLFLMCALFTASLACQKEKTRKITIEGPDEKTEVEIKTTDK